MAIGSRIQPYHLHFGITELDQLLKRDASSLGGIELPTDDGRPGATSVSILGSDGTGKSILAMHLACHYRARTWEAEGSLPKVIYFSTDLSFSQAATTWNKFLLSDPLWRHLHLPSFARPRGLRWLGVTSGLPTGAIGPAIKASLECELTPDLLGKYRQRVLPLRLGPTEEALASYLARQDGPIEGIDRQGGDIRTVIAFIDGQMYPTGDDWLFLQRLVSLLQDPRSACENDRVAWPHMLIIDAVEGLELLGGEHDSFGEKRTSRGRIAQLIRAARGKCHLVFIDEEPEEGVRLDTQYVSDVVIRLRAVPDGPYNRRTIEVEKARGHLHVRGQHDLVIRDGSGTTTGPQHNADDPRVQVAGYSEPMSYVHVLRSVHARSRSLLAAKGFNPPVQPDRQVVCGFGIKYLDNLLPSELTNGEQARKGRESPRGLVGGTVTALIGPMTTYKSRLARAFLAQAISQPLEQLKAHEKLKCPGDPEKPDIKAGESASAVVLMTHQPIDRDGLLRELLKHQTSSAKADTIRVLRSQIEDEHKGKQNGDAEERSLLKSLRNRVLCRRLEMHHLSSAGFIHIVREVVAQAQRVALGEEKYNKLIRGVESQEQESLPDRESKRRFSHGIRVVIDDWKAIKEAFPEAMKDPRLLPYVLDHFRREGVTALILDTEQGVPLIPAADTDTTLRALTDRHIYTWLVPFFGERRVAITTVPPVSSQLPATIYELRPARAEPELRKEPNVQPAAQANPPAGNGNEPGVNGASSASVMHELDDERLIVDPHFEMYSGLEEGKTERVPLKVRLYVGNRSDRTKPEESNYLKNIQDLYRQLFRAAPDEKEVVTAVDMEGYNLLKDYSYLQDGTRLDHTLVLQVDEFWADSHSSLYDLTDYMERVVQSKDDPAVQELEDAYRLYQKQDKDAPGDPQQDSEPGESPDARRTRFNTHEHDNSLSKYHKSGHRFDKVPFLWDFGFLLCNRHAWLEARDRNPSIKCGAAQNTTVEHIWNALCPFELATGKPRPDTSGQGHLGCIDGSDSAVTWLEFFGVLRQLKQREEDILFDIDLRTEEAFSCFVLEVWFSEVRRYELDAAKRPSPQSQAQPAESARAGLKEKLCNDRSGEYRDGGSLLQLVHRYGSQLWWALSVIYRFVPGLEAKNHGFVTKPANPNVFCARHWYSTACDPRYNDGTRVPMRLPGNYSSRGDWFLSVAKGSRSPRLAEHAIDLLCSRRSNLARLLEGIGLPTREL